MTAVAMRRCWLGRVEGIEKWPERPCIAIANHESYLDFLLLGYLSERVLERPYSFWAKTRVVKHGVWSGFAAYARAIEVTRIPCLDRLLEETGQRLDEGRDVYVFPEGQRSRDGRLGHFREGYLWVARELAAPVVPVVLDGAYRAWAPSKTFPAPHRCDIRIHDPIQVSRSLDRSGVTELNQSIRRRYGEWKHEPRCIHNVVSQTA